MWRLAHSMRFLSDLGEAGIFDDALLQNSSP